MAIFHRDIEQNTDEWMKVRAGKITGSRCAPLMASGRWLNGFGAGAKTLAYELANEILMEVLPESWGGNRWTEFGHEHEDIAREAYEQTFFTPLEQVAFVEKNGYIGTSPDRLVVGEKKGVEIKCLPKKHIYIFMDGKAEDSHYYQCMWNMWVCDYDEWDLVYYNHYYPEGHKMKVFTYTRDEALFKEFEERAGELFGIVSTMVGKKITEELFGELFGIKQSEIFDS
jgi:putative phage-type endonuclease